jgi:hypothetical protein
MNKSNKSITPDLISTIMILIFILITTGVIFSQSLPEGYDDDSIDYSDNVENEEESIDNLMDKLNDENQVMSFDSDIIAPLKEDETIFIPLRNPENFLLVSEIDIDDVETEQDKMSLNFLEDLLALDIEPEDDIVHEYVSPDEIGGNNFVFMAIHEKLDDKKGIRSYYEIYLNDKLVGTTNQGSWYGSKKILITKIRTDREYNVIAKLKESTVLGSQWLDALNMYQPNYKEYETQAEKERKDREGELVPFPVINENKDRVTYLFVVWSTEDKSYTIGTGEFHKARHSKFWKALQYFYSNQTN